MYLTRRQREVFDFIKQFIEEHGYSPSLEEIAQGMGLSSLATVHKHLSNLAEKGLIRRHWNKGRGVEIVSDLGSPAMVQVELDASYKLPVKGVVAAGSPIEAIEDPDSRISVPAEMVRNAEDSFVLRVAGESMIDDGINDGDLIVCERRQEARDGQTIIALVKGHEATVKRFYKDGNAIRLQPANSTMEPIYVRPADLLIQGIVIGLIRRYH